mgnify:CR=1 FL=1
MKIVSVIGTRPQCMKLDKDLDQVIVNTGQHYSDGLNYDAFEDDLGLPKPHYELDETELVKMVGKTIKVLKKEKPDLVQVFGDTRSTLAGALAAHEMNIPIAHVEAGMRCGRHDMPEERIRITVDHMSKYLFVPGIQAEDNLNQEKIREHVYDVGNVMFDTFASLCPLPAPKDEDQ